MEGHGRVLAGLAVAAVGIAGVSWWLGRRSAAQRATMETEGREAEVDEEAGTYKPLNSWILKTMTKWIQTGQEPEMDPPLPPLLRSPSHTLLRTRPVPAFGKEMRDQWFTIDPHTRFLNHGSYGGSLKLAIDAQRFYQDQLEKNPVAFIQDTAFPLIVDTLKDLAQFFGARPTELALVTNATTGANAVIRSFPLRKGDVVLCFSHAYAAVSNTIDYACRRVGARLVSVPMSFPTSDEAIKAAVAQALAENPRTVLASFDHITSMPAAIVPVTELAAMCHKAGVKVFVDGAHAMGQVPVNLSELGVDFYTSNLHKWMCTPKGTAVLWVSSECQHMVHPTVMSHGYSLGFSGEFFWQATQDLSAFVSISVALAAFRKVGVDRIMKHNHELVMWAAGMLTTEWGTEALQLPSGGYGSLASVYLPDGHFKATGDDAVSFCRLLRHRYNIEVPISVANGRLFVRISAQMYNHRAEYEAFAQAVKTIQGGLTIMQ